MPVRIIHATLNGQAAVLIYTVTTVHAYVHTAHAWRLTDPNAITRGATILTARDYAARWPGLKLPGYALAA